MKALSLESIRAYILKLLDATYKELESVTSKSKKTLKYHFSIIEKTYPDLAKFVEQSAKVIPQSLEEKLELADTLAKEFLKQAERREEKKEEKEEKKGEMEVKEVEGNVTGYPYLLEDAIERSVSQRAKHMRAEEFEEEKEGEGREKKGEFTRGEKGKLDVFTLFLSLGAAMLGAALILAFSPRGRKREKRAQKVPISPSTHPFSTLHRPFSTISTLRGGIA